MAKYGRIGRDSSHRKATLRNLSIALFKNGRITTTQAKAKEARRLLKNLLPLLKKIILILEEKLQEILVIKKY